MYVNIATFTAVVMARNTECMKRVNAAYKETDISNLNSEFKNHLMLMASRTEFVLNARKALAMLESPSTDIHDIFETLRAG